MSFFGGLFDSSDNRSSSSSSTTQTTNNINPFTFAGSQGVSVSSVNTGGGYVTNNVSNTTLDGDVAIHAMDNMLTSNQDSLLFAHDAQKQAYGFASGVNDTAFSFASATNKDANATTRAAMGSAESSMDKALAFGSRQTAVALDALAGSATMIDTAYKDAKGVLGTNVILAGMGAVVLVMFFAFRKH